MKPINYRSNNMKTKKVEVELPIITQDGVTYEPTNERRLANGGDHTLSTENRIWTPIEPTTGIYHIYKKVETPSKLREVLSNWNNDIASTGEVLREIADNIDAINKRLDKNEQA